MIIYGGIPDKITYVVRPSCEVTRGWDGLDDLWIADAVTATPAFPVDPESKKAMATAEVWDEKYMHASALATVRPAGQPCPVHSWP